MMITTQQNSRAWTASERGRTCPPPPRRVERGVLRRVEKGVLVREQSLCKCKFEL